MFNLLPAVMWHVNNQPTKQLEQRAAAASVAASLSGSQNISPIGTRSGSPVPPSRYTSRYGTPTTQIEQLSDTMCERFVNSSAFNVAGVGLILINVGAMMLDGFPSNKSLDIVLEQVNLIITVLFTFEMIAKIVAFGFGGYVSDAFNRFDGVIVVLSLADIGFTYAAAIYPALQADTPAFTLLRAFRLLRVFRLLRSWTSLQMLLRSLLASLGPLFYLMLLLGLMLFIFALLGMQVRHLPTSQHTYLHTSPHISTHLHTSPHISTHLHISPHISTHLHTPPHTSPHHISAPPFHAVCSHHLLTPSSMLGMQLFGDQFRPPTYEQPPRTNFDSIGNAMITVFSIATIEQVRAISPDLPAFPLLPTASHTFSRSSPSRPSSSGTRCGSTSSEPSGGRR